MLFNVISSVWKQSEYLIESAKKLVFCQLKQNEENHLNLSDDHLHNSDTDNRPCQGLGFHSLLQHPRQKK